MNRLHIPSGSWMRYRKNGRTLWGRKGTLIVWMTTPPPPGTKAYTVAWSSGQQSLLASKIVTV